MIARKATMVRATSIRPWLDPELALERAAHLGVELVDGLKAGLGVIPPSVNGAPRSWSRCRERQRSYEERRDRDLIGGIDHRPAVASGLGGGTHRGVRREPSRVERGEGQRLPVLGP